MNAHSPRGGHALPHRPDHDPEPPRTVPLGRGRPTVRRRWAARRDLVIYVAHRKGGLSQRMLADVFDLARSRVGAIIHELDARTGHEAKP